MVSYYQSLYVEGNSIDNGLIDLVVEPMVNEAQNESVSAMAIEKEFFDTICHMSQVGSPSPVGFRGVF